MKLDRGVPVYQSKSGLLRFGTIREKAQNIKGWQYYKVSWASEPFDGRSYRADSIKVLNVDGELEKLRIVKRGIE